MMQRDTTVLLLKAIGYITIGITTPLGVALAQWSNSGEWPPLIIWIVVIGACLNGGAAQLLAFLSGSYSDYDKKRNGTENTQFLTKQDIKTQ